MTRLFLFQVGDPVIITKDPYGRFQVYPEPVRILGQVPSLPPMYVFEQLHTKHNTVVEQDAVFSYSPELLAILLEIKQCF